MKKQTREREKIETRNSALVKVKRIFKKLLSFTRTDDKTMSTTDLKGKKLCISKFK